MNIKNISSELSERFVEEELAEHWIVDETLDSFLRLMDHLTISTNMYHHFMEAFLKVLDKFNSSELVIVDLGSGVAWTSAIMANNPKVKKVYSIEPSKIRHSSARNIFKHMDVDLSKVDLLEGTFTDFMIKKDIRVDLIVMCSSIHHCMDRDLPDLFRQVKYYLKDETTYSYKDYSNNEIIKKDISRVLLANEHFLNLSPLLFRVLAYFGRLHFLKKDKSKIKHRPGNWNPPDEWDGEHFRTKRQLLKIFKSQSFKQSIFIQKENLNDKDGRYKDFYQKLINLFGLKSLSHYFAILEEHEE